MAQVEWGTKRQCASCGVKFYDLRRDPIICPRCEVVFEPAAAARWRTTAAATAVAVAETSPVVAAQDVEIVIEGKDAKSIGDAGGETSPVVAAQDVEIVIEGKDAKSIGDAGGANVVEEDDDTDDLIEDVSELGEDDDVVADVAAAAPKDDDER